MGEKEEKLTDRIVVNPKIMAGKPVVKGTRIPVYIILESIEAGKTIEDILESYPDLSEKDVKAAIKYATKIIEREDVRKRKIDFKSTQGELGEKLESAREFIRTVINCYILKSM